MDPINLAAAFAPILALGWAAIYLRRTSYVRRAQRAAAKWLFAKLDPHTQRAMEAAYADWACDAAPIEVHQIVEDREAEEMTRRAA